MKMKKSTAEKIRKLKMGTTGAVITASFIIFVLLFNIGLSLVLNRFPLKFDMTGNEFYGVSDESKVYLDTLDDNVTITIFNSESGFAESGVYYKQVDEVAKAYDNYSNKITLKYVDLIKNPGYANNYPGETIKTNNIMVESEKTKRRIVLTDDEYFNKETSTTSYTQTVVSSKGDQALVSSILSVAIEDPQTFGIIEGHSEDSFSAGKALLQKNGYVFETVSLYNKDLDLSKYDGLFIVAPERDYTDEELNMLETYLDNNRELGKSIFFFASEDVGNLPNLYAFLAEWGIEIGSGTIYETDTSKFLMSSNYISKLTFKDTLYAENIYTKNIPLTAPNSRPMKKLFDAQETISVTELLAFTDTVVVQPDNAETNWSPDKAEQKGPFSAVLKATKIRAATEVGGAYQTLDSNIIAFSGEYFVDKNILELPIFSNAEYLVSMVNTVYNRKDAVSIIPKYVESKSMAMTQAQAGILGIFFAVIVPIAIIVCGVVVFIRRRHS